MFDERPAFCSPNNPNISQKIDQFGFEFAMMFHVDTFGA